MKDITIPKGKVQTYVYYGLILLVVFVIAAVLIKVFKAAKAGSTAAGDAAGAVIIQAQTGITPNRQNVCRSVADDVRAACTIDPLFHFMWYIDQEKVITALNRLVTPVEAQFTSDVFKQLCAKSIKSDVLQDSAFSSSQRAQVQLLNYFN